MTNLLLVGGGHAHLAVLKNLSQMPLDGVTVTVVSRDVYTAYSGMLPGLIAGHHSFDSSHIDLRPLARKAGARFLAEEVLDIDPDTRLAHLSHAAPLSFDVCSINSGSITAAHLIPGGDQNTTVLKPVSKFLSVYRALLAQVAETHEPLRIGFVGGGAGSVELLLAMQYAAQRTIQSLHKPTDFVRFYLFEQHDEILHTHPPKVQQMFRKIFETRQVRLFEGTPIVEAGLGYVATGDGERIALDHVFLVAGAHPPEWISTSTLATDENGFIAVQDTLQSVSHPHIFAAGDLASMVDHPREKSGVIAVRQGPPLARNLRRLLDGRPLIPFTPQKNWLSLISTGNKNAVVSWGDLAFQSPLAWTWKEMLDRSFIRQHTL